MATTQGPNPGPARENDGENRSGGEFPALPGEGHIDEDINSINTCWQVLDQAKARGPGCREAQEWVLLRYERAVRRYLSAALPDDDAVSEVYQEYAKLLAEGGFANVEAARGKFRHYLKRVLSNLVNDYYRHKKRQRHLPIDSHIAEPQAPPEPEPLDDQEFTAAWRRDLQEHAWARLQMHELRTGKPLYTLLKHKALHNDCRSYQMAEQFADLLGPSASANKVRKLLLQARGLYSEMLLNGVAETIDGPSAEVLEEELIELDLHKYCRDALDGWKRRNGQTGGAGR